MGLDLRNKFDFDAQGVLGTVTKNTTTSIDFKIVDTGGVYINGGTLLLQDHVWGDWFEIQIIDIDNILGYGANTVLKNYIKKWYVHPDMPCLELEAEYAGHILKDLYLRCKYHSVGTTNNVKVALNYKMHIAES